MTSMLCSWCHRLNSLGTPRCQCGHSPFRSRMDCDCDQCQRQRAEAQAMRVKEAVKVNQEDDGEDY